MRDRIRRDCAGGQRSWARATLRLFPLLGLLMACGGVSTHYDTGADPERQLADALAVAPVTGRLILLQLGGDWCPWCVRLNRTIERDSALCSLTRSRFVRLLIHTGRKGENADFIRAHVRDVESLSYPYFVLLRADGEWIGEYTSHTLIEGGTIRSNRVRDLLETMLSDARADSLSRAERDAHGCTD